MASETHVFSRREELANAITHGVGSLLSVTALVILIVYASIYGTALHIVSVAIFGATMTLLYVNSTLLHSFPTGKVKNLFEIFDHSSIYLFIAGTYTPFLFLALDGALSWILFGIVWGIAAIGITFKAFFVKRFVLLSTVFYIGMGWIIVIAWQPLSLVLPPEGMMLLLAGGIFYTVGTVFYVWRSFPYHHAVWHVFVIAGSAAHFFAVFRYVLPL
ncbi:hemolysin III family protein [Geomicrobium sp. JCM 19039]|uniref:PAQR family membrane homeostasis protein TrhA n=1 Tax=Geomicrobium sp. JCM 19039 TaxID=1460636 RepID=UPI00045F1507|nr:hemolysin III family protein [Geomicrobium sp. JCM 19039]GAK10692.1 predicted membrane protein hemolysin III homolog [Geomicrobium sp. JCM 19039]